MGSCTNNSLEARIYLVRAFFIFKVNAVGIKGFRVGEEPQPYSMSLAFWMGGNAQNTECITHDVLVKLKSDTQNHGLNRRFGNYRVGKNASDMHGIHPKKKRRDNHGAILSGKR